MKNILVVQSDEGFEVAMEGVANPAEAIGLLEMAKATILRGMDVMGKGEGDEGQDGAELPNGGGA